MQVIIVLQLYKVLLSDINNNLKMCWFNYLFTSEKSGVTVTYPIAFTQVFNILNGVQSPGASASTQNSSHQFVLSLAAVLKSYTTSNAVISYSQESGYMFFCIIGI